MISRYAMKPSTLSMGSIATPFNSVSLKLKTVMLFSLLFQFLQHDAATEIELSCDFRPWKKNATLLMYRKIFYSSRWVLTKIRIFIFANLTNVLVDGK
jgi:hypothetical protein